MSHRLVIVDPTHAKKMSKLLAGMNVPVDVFDSGHRAVAQMSDDGRRSIKSVIVVVRREPNGERAGLLRDAETWCEDIPSGGLTMISGERIDSFLTAENAKVGAAGLWKYLASIVEWTPAQLLILARRSGVTEIDVDE